MSLWYRATCLGRPIGPWRRVIQLAREDLIERELGEYTERGAFYITVPGDLEIEYKTPHSRAA